MSCLPDRDVSRGISVYRLQGSPLVTLDLEHDRRYWKTRRLDFMDIGFQI